MVVSCAVSQVVALEARADLSVSQSSVPDPNSGKGKGEDYNTGKGKVGTGSGSGGVSAGSASSSGFPGYGGADSGWGHYTGVRTWEAWEGKKGTGKGLDTVAMHSVDKGLEKGKPCAGKPAAKSGNSWPGFVSGTPVYVAESGHRPGYKVHVAGLPQQTSVELTDWILRHWLQNSLEHQVPWAAFGGATVGSVMAALGDVNWNHNAVSRGGYSLGLLCVVLRVCDCDFFRFCHCHQKFHAMRLRLLSICRTLPSSSSSRHF